MVIVYTGNPMRAGRTRRTPLSASLTEQGLLSLAVASNHLQLKPRTRRVDSAVGESTTWNNTYTGVKLRTSSEMALVRREQKKQILENVYEGVLPEDWPHGQNAEPLFWAESKSLQFWMNLYEDLNIKCVYDMTPGAGAAAEAALVKGVVYHGVCVGPGQ